MKVKFWIPEPKTCSVILVLTINGKGINQNHLFSHGKKHLPSWEITYPQPRYFLQVGYGLVPWRVAISPSMDQGSSFNGGLMVNFKELLDEGTYFTEPINSYKNFEHICGNYIDKRYTYIWGKTTNLSKWLLFLNFIWLIEGKLSNCPKELIRICLCVKSWSISPPELLCFFCFFFLWLMARRLHDSNCWLLIPYTSRRIPFTWGSVFEPNPHSHLLRWKGFRGFFHTDPQKGMTARLFGCLGD